MSKNESLKDIIAKRYAGLKKEESPVLQEMGSIVKKVDENDEIKKETEKTVSYLPHRIGNKYFLIKIQYSLDVESDFVSQSDIEILGVVPLAQKIIALQYEQTQAKSLKYYYDSQKSKELK